MKLPTFRSLRAKLSTSDDVATALKTNAAQLATSRAELASMEDQRPGLLLDGDDSAVDSLEARLVDVRRLVARLEARSDALEAELAEIGAREAAAALAKLRIDAQADADEARSWLRSRYPEIVRELMDGLSAIRTAEDQVRAANTALTEAGQPDQVRGVEDRQRYHRDANGWVYYISANPSLLEHIVLPEIRTQDGDIIVGGYNDQALRTFL